MSEGIAHGQLPISEYFWMKQRKVLTINQGRCLKECFFLVKRNCFAVFEILIRVSEGKSFKEAFELVLPKRKEILSLDSEESTNESNSIN